MIRRWLSLAFLALPAVEPAGAVPLYGDVNGDGVLNYRDAIILLRVAGGLRANSDSVRRTGDVAPLLDYNGGSFGDGNISMQDALRVFRRASGLSTAAWPAKTTGYVLEAGNTRVIRRYDAGGSAVTGPDLDVPDPTITLTGPFSEPLGGSSLDGVYYATSSSGEAEHLAQVMDATSSPGSLQATQLVFGGNTAAFNPPLVVIQYPFQDGATWFGVTNVTDLASGATLPATYSGSIQGPVTVTTADQNRAFDNAWKVTIAYSTPYPGPSGTEYYWFVPFLGPVQHGYSRSFLGQTTTIVPAWKLVSANVHGVLYP